MTKKNHTLSSVTKMVQALRYLDKDSGAIVPPIQSTATYARDENYEIKKRIGIEGMVMRPPYMLKK